MRSRSPARPLRLMVDGRYRIPCGAAARDRRTVDRQGRRPRRADPRTPRRSDRRSLPQHPLDNVLRNIRLLCEGDPDKQFGLSGLPGACSPSEVLGLVGRAAGFTPDPNATTGPVPVVPELVIDACDAVGYRLGEACARGERMILATGHPVGLAHLYTGVGRQLAARGVELLRPYEGVA